MFSWLDDSLTWAGTCVSSQDWSVTTGLVTAVAHPAPSGSTRNAATAERLGRRLRGPLFGCGRRGLLKTTAPLRKARADVLVLRLWIAGVITALVLH